MKKFDMKKIIAAAAAISMMASFSSCGEKVENVNTEPETTAPVTEAETQTATEAAKEEAVSKQDPTSLAHNPLTGEYGYNPDAVGKRPVAVMINNIDQALPQYGIGSADYLYELVVEGGITRMMAVFGDYTNVPTLCSIRSCRYYYPLIANGLDAIYCHWGMDMTIAKETLERLGIDRFDGDDARYNGGLFYKDSERLQYYSSEHAGCLDGSQLADYISGAGFRTDVNNSGADYMKFADGTDLYEIPGEACDRVVVSFSDSYFSTFTYDEAEGKYFKQHSGTPQVDAATGEQLSFTNVFALKTNVSMREDGYRMDVDLSSGSGYYLSGGKIQEIYWTKGSDSSNFVFTDTSGNEITVNRGKCYIGITNNIIPSYND